MTFVIRTLNHSQTLGEKLKAMRRAANLTLSEMEKKTKIRKSLLRAFESGAFHALPDPIYARNYLKIYVRVLGGDTTYFLDQFEEERGTCDFVGQARLPLKRTRPWQFLVASRFIKIAILLIFSASLLSYIGWQIRSIVAPPALVIFEPADGFLTENALIRVTGKTEDGANIMINGTEVLLNQDGKFETEIPLERGLNVITVEGSKRYSRSAVQYRHVVLEQHRVMGVAF